MNNPSLPLRSFRLVCKPQFIPLVEGLLSAQGFVFEEEAFSPFARRLTHGPFALGASIAAFFGYIYIQDRSSMLPPLLLGPESGSAVLDMCASPGSKTGLLGQLVGNGFVLGNEPSRNRLATLRRNLQALNLFCCATCSHAGEKIPLPSSAWPFIQLDPPCSGWGTVDKNPQVMRLWQGEKIKPLITLQRRLLAEASRLLRPGGKLVYSTCTTNVEENEAQIRYAREELGLVFRPAAPPPGFDFAEPALSEFSGVWRVNTGVDGQGFFVALLEKPAEASGSEMPAHGENNDKPEPASTALSESVCRSESLKQGFFIRPWEKESRYVGERRRHGRGNPGPRENPAFEILPRACFESGYTDPALLPPGDIAVFNSVAHFLPEASRELLPPGFAWKGFALGKTRAQGELRPNSRLRDLMPAAETARQKGLQPLNLDDLAPIEDLIRGQSLSVDVTTPETGLYYRDLPLCRLTVKGKRAILPPG